MTKERWRGNNAQDRLAVLGLIITFLLRYTPFLTCRVLFARVLVSSQF